MLVMIVAAALVCVGALALGQAVLQMCGATRWSWLSPAVGVSVLMLLAVYTPHVPGRATTVSVVIAVAIAAAIVTIARRGQLPPPLGLLAGAPVLLLGLLPYAAAGHGGILGMSVNNDMAAHLLWADAFSSAEVEAVNPLNHPYPLGPHAIAGTLAATLGTTVDLTFSGLTLALPVLLGWTALAAFRSPRVWGVIVVPPLVGLTFLVAGYYGQGSFKEVLQPLLVLAVALALAYPPPLTHRLRWIPIALMLAGSLSVFGHFGLSWPIVFIATLVAGRAAILVWRHRTLRPLLEQVSHHLAPTVIALGVLVVAMIPQIPRSIRLLEDTAAASNLTGIDASNLGNLAGPLPFWQVFGMWDSGDYRFAGTGDRMGTRLLAAFAIALVLLSVVWCLRRREWMLPAAAGGALLIWFLSDRSQSPYVAAKALVLLAPFVMLLALLPLVERDDERARMPSWWRFAAPGTAAVLAVGALGSSWGALTFSKVGSQSHIEQIRAIRPMLNGQPTLYLGNDDYTRWMFAGVPVGSPVIGFPVLSMRPEKPWEYGRNYDIDSLDAVTLNTFEWVVAPRDPASSAVPDQLRLVRRTMSFDVYRRTGPIPARRVLSEGESSAARFDCSTRFARAILRRGGVAAVRPASVVVPAPIVPAGETASVTLPLTPGAWDLGTSYGGPRAVRVTAPGLRVTLPANLARPGPRWPIGRIEARGPVTVTFAPTKEALTPKTEVTFLNAVTATPVEGRAIVPIADACGRLVDWYRTRRPER